MQKAADALRYATAVLFTSGAGLGVDSGLPDFRGPQGFWRAYPPMKEMGLEFSSISNPAWFTQDPKFAWGFWGHRYDLYTKAAPHAGYQFMRQLGERMRDGYFSFTSNVDGHFARVFPDDRILECHGCIHYLQCFDDCSPDLWETQRTVDVEKLRIDMTTFKAMGPLPACPKCHGLARPNVLMFGDYGWNEDRFEVQLEHYEAWMASLKEKKDTRLVVVEIGAGTGVPTVRKQSERRVMSFEERFGKGSAVLMRINPRDHHCPATVPCIPIPLGGLDALARIQDALHQQQ